MAVVVGAAAPVGGWDLERERGGGRGFNFSLSPKSSLSRDLPRSEIFRLFLGNDELRVGGSAPPEEESVRSEHGKVATGIGTGAEAVGWNLTPTVESGGELELLFKGFVTELIPLLTLGITSFLPLAPRERLLLRKGFLKKNQLTG